MFLKHDFIISASMCMIVCNTMCITIIFLIIIVFSFSFFTVVIVDMTCFDWNIMIVMLDIRLCKNYILITTYHTNE